MLDVIADFSRDFFFVFVICEYDIMRSVMQIEVR